MSYTLISYNPIENVFQWMADYYFVLSPNFDVMINNDKITLKRKLIYYTNFAIQLSILIKYIYLAIYDDPDTVGLLGESFHYLTNIYYVSHIYLAIQLTLLPCLMYIHHIGDRRVANIFVTISRFDNNLALNRINNRKVTTNLLVMNKVAAIILMQSKWLVYPLVYLFCAISVYLEQPRRYNVVTLAINSIVQWVGLVNVTGRVTKLQVWKMIFRHFTFEHGSFIILSNII